MGKSTLRDVRNLILISQREIEREYKAVREISGSAIGNHQVDLSENWRLVQRQALKGLETPRDFGRQIFSELKDAALFRTGAEQKQIDSMIDSIALRRTQDDEKRQTIRDTNRYKKVAALALIIALSFIIFAAFLMYLSQ